MTKVPLKLSGGFYQARSLIANQQRCVNLYPERNAEDSPFPFTMYQTPGLGVLVAGNGEPGRGLYPSTDGKLFLVSGQRVYYIDGSFNATLLGTLTADISTPVCMQDNGIDLVIVDGTTGGKIVNLSTLVMTNYSDPNFLGADYVGYLDTFLVFNQPGTRNFYNTLSNSTTIDPLDIAAKTGYPDNIASLIVMHLDIWLLGSQKSTEIWNNVGGLFPFARQPGIFIEHGCVAKYSVAKHDLIIFWLGLDADGTSTVFMGSNYQAKKISTPAIAAEFGKYSVVSDAIGFVYKQIDHIFYFLTFPTANKTWVFDLSEGLWHERSWLDVNGVENRHRAMAGAVCYNRNVCLDWENGTLYEFDLEKYTDNASPIKRTRSFPHVVSNGSRITHSSFIADMMCGQLTPDDPAQVSLRWSDDRGMTFGNPVVQLLGSTGDYLKQPKWSQLGLARDRVYELSWSADVNTALNGAYLDATPGAT